MTTLEFRSRIPPSAPDDAPVLVLLHGRGSDENDLLGLAPHLPADWIVITPRAPFSGLPWGYGPGWAWYQFQGGARPEPKSFTESVARIGDFLEQLPVLLARPAGPVVLGGFSQGGTVSLGYALQRPGGAPLVVNLSGFLPEHPAVEVTPATAAGIDLFWGHGTEDPNIPYRLATAGWDQLRQAGARLTARSYRMGHTITEPELDDLIAWIGDRTTRR
jgi:phospholipase/carboxylesterase